MLSRRLFLASALATPILTPLSADAREGDTQPPDEISEDGLLEDYADFAGNWSSDDKNSQEFFAVVPDIPTGIVEPLSAKKFTQFSEIESFFQDRTGHSYISWFNTAVAGKNAWIKKRMDPAAEADFASFWTSYLAQRPLSALEFIAYMSVFANEAGGALRSHTESYGAKGHPGIAYLFNVVTRVAPNKKIWRKQSYNRYPNRTAASLFNDIKYIKSHGKLTFADELKGSKDALWDAQLYPVGKYPTSAQPENFITECDFVKFRGRGLIQTTWRSNYIPLVKFVKGYKGDDKVLTAYKELWTGLVDDDICTISTSADWDAIFESPSRGILSFAVIRHQQMGKYLPLADTTRGANGNSSSQGSIACMGKRIGGNDLYGATLKDRVRDICIALA